MAGQKSSGNIMTALGCFLKPAVLSSLIGFMLSCSPASRPPVPLLPSGNPVAPSTVYTRYSTFDITTPPSSGWFLSDSEKVPVDPRIKILDASGSQAHLFTTWSELTLGKIVSQQGPHTVIAQVRTYAVTPPARDAASFLELLGAQPHKSDMAAEYKTLAGQRCLHLSGKADYTGSRFSSGQPYGFELEIYRCLFPGKLNAVVELSWSQRFPQGSARYSDEKEKEAFFRSFRFKQR